MTDPTSRRLDCINYLLCQLSNDCSLINCIYISSIDHIFILFVSLKVKKVFMIRGFELSYILLDEKLPSCIKDPQHEENNLITAGYIGSIRDKASFDLPRDSLCFNSFNKR